MRSIENYLPQFREGGVNFLKHIQAINDGTVTSPTIAVTTQAGITAAALTAGATDIRGFITTTGTSTGGTVLTVTFANAYTTAPVVHISPANAAGGGVNTMPIPVASTTGFTLTIPSAGVYAATPSWQYLVLG